MKIILFLENNPGHLRMDYRKIYNPEKYKFFILAAPAAYQDLIATEQYNYCELAYKVENFDFENLKKIAQEIEKKHGQIAKFVTLEELSVRLCGELSKDFGLADEHYERFVDKDVMKKILGKTYPSSIPHYVLFDKEAYQASPENYINELKIPFPLFIKPTDMVGSIEASKVRNKNEFKAWAEHTTDIDFQYEIDEFIDGELYHADSFIQNGKIVFTGVGVNSFPCAEFLNGKTTGSMLLDANKDIYKRICKFTQKIHDHLGMPQSGVTHLEIFLTANGELKFLEIAYRPAGAYIPQMYIQRYGLDIHTAHVLLQIDDDYKLQLQNGLYVAYLDYPPKAGVLEKREDKLDVTSNYNLTWTTKEKDVIEEPEQIADWICRLVLTNKNPVALKQEFDALKINPPFRIKPTLLQNIKEERGVKLITKLGFYKEKPQVQVVSAPSEKLIKTNTI